MVLKPHDVIDMYNQGKTIDSIVFTAFTTPTLFTTKSAARKWVYSVIYKDSLKKSKGVMMCY